MTIGWPIAVIAVTFIVAVAVFLTLAATGGMRMESEKTKGERADDYRKLVSAYETLTAETREAQKAMQAELAEMRAKVDSIERLMREVG